MAVPEPEKDMIKFFEPLIYFQFLPCGRINLTSNAADIKSLLNMRQGFGFDADTGQMIIPARMLSKSRERDPRLGGFAGWTASRLLALEKSSDSSGVHIYYLGQSSFRGRG